MCAATVPLANLPHLFWAFSWWNDPQLSLLGNYVSVILTNASFFHQHRWQQMQSTFSTTVTAVNMSHLYQRSCLSLTPSSCAIQPSVPGFKEFLASCRICLSFPHRRILRLRPCLTGTSWWCCMPRQTAAAVGCVDVELRSKTCILDCFQGKNSSELVFILPFAPQ